MQVLAGVRNEVSTDVANKSAEQVDTRLFPLTSLDRGPSPYSAHSIGVAVLCFVVALAAHLAFRGGGALSGPSGRVIALQNADDFARVDWKEEGGPPVSPPKMHGFGSRIVARGLKTISGSIAPAFPPEGVRLAVKFRA